MKKRPQHLFRLATAVLLLGIFISVHLAKAFHTHAVTSTISKFTGAGEKVQAASDCATCDYHFTKDSSSETATIALVPTLYYASVYLSYKSYLASSIGLLYSDRGPPAIA
jgi:hypothetical protein